ncbi:MAG: hypothetical protein QM722_16910 [Piscinibacter sp.]
MWAALWLAGCGGSEPAETTPPRYRLLDIGTLDGHTLDVIAINDHGDSTGTATAPGGRVFDYVTRGASIVDLSALYAGSIAPLAINNAGWVAGRCVPDDPSDVIGFEPERPFVYDGSALRQLHDELGEGGEAWAINDDGVIAGRTQVILETDYNQAEAFRYDGTRAELLGHLGGLYSDARGINASGQITGFSQIARELGQSPPPPYHAFRRDDAGMHDLGTLGGVQSFGAAINGAGWVTGRAQGADGAFRAFLHDGGTMQDLGLLDGRATAGTAINAAGQVVGQTWADASADQVAVVAHDGRLHDLNALLVEPSDWRMASALAIDVAGRVLVRGVRAGSTRSFLLVPTD